MSEETPWGALTPTEKLNRLFAQAPDWTPETDPAPEPAPLPADASFGGPGGPALPRFIDLDELDALPPPAWCITGLVPKGVLSCVFGPPGAGKSFLVLDWALSVATGRPWAGHAVTPGPVVYIAAEGHSGLAARVSAWEAANGSARSSPVWLLLGAANLLDPLTVDGLLRGLAASLGRVEATALLIVDTLARSMIGGDENSARDMGLLIAAADRLRLATGATVVLVHHTGKNGLVERGSSALRGACDMMASVQAEDGLIMLTCVKMKDAPEFPASRWTLAPRGASCVLVPSEVVLANPHRDLSPAQRAVLEALAGPVFGGSATQNDLRLATNLTESTLYRALKTLVERGFVEVSGGEARGQAKIYQLTDAGANMV